MEGIYQHFRENERQFIDVVLKWKEQVESQYSPKLTDFLDPREQWIIKSIIGHHGDVLVSFFGGEEQVERKRAILYPSYFVPSQDDFQLVAYEIQYPKKFITLEHRQILGSLMSLGIKREKFGDILIIEDSVQMIVAEEIASYVEVNFQEVGRATISLKRIPFNQIIVPESDYLEKMTTTSSLRLDVVCAAIYNLSRQKIKSLIQNGYVKVNWKVVDDPSFEVGEEDLLSIRGFGRSKMIAVEGRTKKDKRKIIVGIKK